MHLNRFIIENYRKFGKENNSVSFSANIKDSNLIGSTLVIGQNNAGKTSIVTALKKASGAENFSPTDFNFNYLYKVLNFFYTSKVDIKNIFIYGGEDPHCKRDSLLDGISPYMKFGYEFQVDLKNKESNELLTNIAPIIKNEIDNDGIIKAFVKYELKEQLKFVVEFYSEFGEKDFRDSTFGEFLEFLIKGSFFESHVYTDEECTEKIDGFAISNLVKVNSISFEKLHTSGRLSAAFNKIYTYKVSNNPEIKKRLEGKIKEINKNIDDVVSIDKELSKKVNNAVGKALDQSNASMLLKPDLTIDSLLRNVIKYVYKDGEFEIPEDQFGMGYTNLMLIIAELVDYVDNSPEVLFRNTINLLVIEEPESYMHPQMQKLLIQNLNNAVMAILDEKDEKVKLNCQLIITSHSANIVHGKLQAEDTFNNINYISCLKDSPSFIVSLDDASITPSGKNSDGNEQEEIEAEVRDEAKAEGESKAKAKAEAQFNFLKKHIKYSCCDLFFADACLIVEGYAEQIILPFYLERDRKINKKYISVLNINGAFSHVYSNLFKKLNIPIAIITDLDIEGSSSSDDQITSLEGKKTTNSALKGFGFTIGVDFEKQDDNVYVVTQEQVGNYYPTSFEESLILSNVNNVILKNTLSSVIPSIYGTHSNHLAEKSHLLLNKIGSNKKKGAFATKLLYNLVNADNNAELPKMPVYIQKALDYVSASLNKNDKIQKDEEEVILDD